MTIEKFLFSPILLLDCVKPSEGFTTSLDCLFTFSLRRNSNCRARVSLIERSLADWSYDLSPGSVSLGRCGRVKDIFYCVGPSHTVTVFWLWSSSHLTLDLGWRLFRLRHCSLTDQTASQLFGTDRSEQGRVATSLGLDWYTIWKYVDTGISLRNVIKS